jgi:hypothetical protein
MTRKVVSPIALDKSINTTEVTPRNIADVLAQQLDGIKTAIETGNGNLEAAFVCYYGVTTATQIKNAIEDGKVPYFYYNGVVAQLWKVETDKYTFRTTNTRSVEGQTILDVVDYVVNGSVWSTVTSEVSGGSSSGQSYITSVNSLADFDTTGKSGMQDLVSVANVPADGVYQLSVLLHITPKTASATKSDIVLQFTSSDNTGWPSHTFHAVVDDSQTFAQQLSFSTSVSLKAGQNTLRIQCGDLNTEYLVFVDELTVAQLVNGVYHNKDDVVSISLAGGGSYVSNADYDRAFAGAEDNRIVILRSAYGSVTSQGYLIAVGSVGLRFMMVVNDNVQLVSVSPTETSDGHAVTYEDLANGGGFTDIVAFEFTDYTDSVAGNIAYPISNDKMQIQSDWDGGLSVQAAFIAPSDTSNNAIVKLENVQTTINWNVQIWNHSKTALLPLVPGSATVFKKDASYVIHLYGDKVYVSQVVNKESAPVTEADLQEAINTLRSRSVFVMDVGEIAGQVTLNPNGSAGFIGTLFSPYMDFDLSVDTKVVFDVEQMGGQGEMTRFVIALYEYDSATGQFNWVANTGDLSTQLDSADRRLGLHSGKLQYIRQNAKLYGGKMYYAVACGHWNGWAFAGNTFATTLHSSVTPAFQCDNRSEVIDPATLGSGSYAKLYATDQGDQTKVDYHNISGNRMFMTFTNSAVSI